MKSELLSKVETALDDLGNSQTIQIRRFTVRIACSEEKASGVAR